MKNHIINIMKAKSILMAAALAITACSAPTAPKHDAAGTAMLERLQKIFESGNYMYGHQDDLMYGKYWNVNNDGVQDYSRSDVLFTAGDFPAIAGFEIGEIELKGEYSLDSVKFDYIRGAVQAHHRRGGVSTLSWHPNNPLTGGTAWDVSSNQVVLSILPGGCEHEKFMGWLDTVASFLDSLRDDEGNLIPIIWRPWHEHCGGWFWWGINGLCTPEDYVSLWKMTYNYMVDERGLSNLIWAISPDLRSEEDYAAVNASYPGDEYIDIIGFDCYGWEFDDPAVGTAEYVSRMKQTLALMSKYAADHGKLFALTETGKEGIPDPYWWTNGLAKALEGYNVLYALTWRNASDEAHKGHYYSAFPGEPSAADFKAFAKLPQTLFLKDIQ